jgi:hypothetical protein
MTKLWHECITCLKMKKYSKGIMENICKKCLENNHCQDSEKCDCNICNDNSYR